MAETEALTHEQTFLLTGEDYKASLRDGRKVWYRGELIEDVAVHASTAGGASWLAELYDLQHDPETRDVMTYVREDGTRVTRAWQIPRTREDLCARRKFVELTSRKTLGLFGRQLDNIACTTLGLVAYEHLFRAKDAALADNILEQVRRAEEGNVTIAGLIADPQGARSKQKWSLGDRTGELQDAGERLPPLLRVTKRTPDGVRISGAKIVGTLLPQAHEMIVITQPFVEPEESFWGMVPANAPGVHVVLRQSFARPVAFSEHPVVSRGEEMDCLIIFDDVFVPTERLLSVGHPELALEYGQIGTLEHWNTLIRMCVKAEIFAGLTQVVVDALGTGKVPKVRELVSDVIEHAQVLRGLVIAAEDQAQPTESGVLWPAVNMVTAGRVYGIEHYGRLVQNVRELAGQGPLMLFANEDFDQPEVGPLLSDVISGFGVSAKEKNLLMGLVWDLTCDGTASRMDMFERLNGYPLFFLKERQYSEYDRTAMMDLVADFIGLPKPSEQAKSAG